MEKPIFFNNRNNERLFGVLYLPDNDYKVGIVICQPIAEERHRTKRVLVSLARFLSSSGFAVLLFDYYGEGDSGGNFESVDIQSRTSDILSAVDFLKIQTKVSVVGLIGMRLGATICLLAEQQESKIYFNILCQPVINGKEYLQEWLKINVASQLTSFGKIRVNRQQLLKKIAGGESIEIEGFELGSNLGAQLCEIDLLTRRNQSSKKKLIVEFINGPYLQNNSIKKLSLFDNNEKRMDYLCLNKTFDWKSLKNFNPWPKEFFEKILFWLNINVK